ncbi:hypothetical protein [Lactobacillus delbrueckii]|uniref:hypothetical protein n=1 Tax=Lactobacillus delbrueckii TaxID=1584 RepID=UPI003996363C
MTLFLIVALTTCLAVYFAIKDRQNRQRLDERQLLLRGRSYKYAFWTVFVANILYSLACINFDRPLATPFVSSLATIILGGTVLTCYCIFQDVFPVKERLNLAATWTLIFFSQLMIQIGGLMSGKISYFKNGAATDEAVGPLILAAYLAIVGSLLIKAIIDRREED